MKRLVDTLVDLPYPDHRLAVALSGGPDSAALLHSLVAVHGAKRVRAIHVCHHLQPQAEAWAAHCAQLCADWHVSFTRLDVCVDVRAEGMEASARRARYRVLAQALDTGEQLAVAHHADDQAETFLIQALRGAGVHGLAGMPSVKALGAGWLWRPWLTVPQAAIARYVVEHGLAVINDPSNIDTAVDRGYIRQALWPAVQTRWPAAADTLSRSAGWAAQAAEAVDALAAIDLGATSAAAGCLSIAALAELSCARRGQVYRRWIAQAGRDCPDHRHVQQIDRLLSVREHASPRVVYAHTEIRRFDGRLFVMSRLPLAPDATLAWGGGLSTIELPAGAGKLSLTDGSSVAQSPPHTEELTVRFRRGGEQLIERDGRMIALKDWFQSHRVPPWLRERAPLIWWQDQLIAVADCWLQRDCAQWPAGRVLSFCWQHDMPTGR